MKKASCMNSKTVPQVIVLLLCSIIALSTLKPATAEAINYFSVPIDSYDSFRAATVGKGYDIDGSYGCQCWDGAALFWQQLGMWLETGSGEARGCWLYRKEVNAGNQFDLIYNIGDVKRGDVVVLNIGDYGHIAFADEDYHGGNWLKLYGQNQNYTAEFNSCNLNVQSFLGAFRYKGWSVPHGSYMQTGYDRILPDGDYVIACASNPSFYLDISGGDYPAAAGTNVILWYNEGGNVSNIGDHDAWTIQYSGGFYRITQYHQNVSLDVHNADTARGQNVQVWTSNDSSGQQWAISKNADGSYRLQARCSGYSLDVSGGVFEAEKNVWQWEYIDYNAQKWVFLPYKQNYTVTYDANGGTGAPNSQTANYGTSLTLSSTTPTRASSTGNYTVTLNANGGSVSSPSLSSATTTQYTFKNWNTKKDGSGTSYNPGASYTANTSVTLYAQWNSSTSATAVTLPTPTRTGYDFKGWATSSSANSGVTGSYTPSGNVTLYATWKIKTYTVSYNANGGSGAPGSQTKAYGQALTLLTTAPTRPCHTFLGWAASASATSASYQPGQSYTANANLTLYAVWAEGVSTEWSSTKPTGVDESLIETKTQYRYRDKETKTSYEPNLSDYTLVSSRWVQTATGTIDYVSSWPGGFDSSNGYYSQYNKTPKTASETTTNKTVVSNAGVCGYIYWHWCAGYQYGPVNRLISDVYTDARPYFHAFFTTDDAPHSDPNTGAYDPDCYYYWHRDCCRDTYWWFRLNVNRQTFTDYKNEFTYERWGNWSAWSDSKYTESSTRQVEERTLYRYTQDGTDVHSWNSGTVTTAATCTAAGVKTYTCSKCGKTRTESLPALGHNWGSWSVTTPATATSPGVETRTCSRCGQTETREIPQLQTYLVTYNANGGTGAPDDQYKIQGTTLKLSSQQPSRANSSAGSYIVTLNANGGTVSSTSLSATCTTSYSFKNWNTAANGSGTSYSPGASYTADAAATLYAQWNSSATTAAITLPTPTREGYDFKGWATTNTATSGTTGSYTPTGNVTLYAIWQIKTYPVAYNANGGTGAPANQTKTHGTALTLSSTKPTRANASAGSYTVTLNANGGTVSSTSLSATRTTSYFFKNWNTAANGSGTSYAPGASYTANAAVTLYAQWNSSTSTKEVTLPTAAREGSLFLGWAKSSTATDAQYNPGDTLTPTGNLTLYAVWLDLSKPDGVLPAALTALEDEALAGCAFRYVKLPDGMTKLGSRVFDGSLKLRAVYVPASVTTIASTAFDGAPDGLTIVGEAGSYAEFFASRHGLSFVEG